MSMKQTINALIRTRLQEGQEEREICLVTPANSKVPSTGEPPEPDPGMLPRDQEKQLVGSPNLALVLSRDSSLKSRVHDR